MSRLLILPFFIFSHLAFCQYLIPKLGVSISKVSDSDVVEGSSRPRNRSGLAVGIAYTGKSTKQIVFVPEIYFIQKGYLIRETGNSFSSDIEESIDIRINYLQLPLLIRVYPSIESRSFYLSFGLYESIALGGKYSYYFKENNNGNITKVSITDRKIDFQSDINGYNSEQYSVNSKNDIGVDFGLGFQVFKKAVLDFRYTVGFTVLSKEVDANQKNRSLLMSIGVPLKTK